MFKHILTIDSYNKFVFNDAVEAFECYQLLMKSRKVESTYPTIDGKPDYNNPSEILSIPVISITLQKS